MLWSASYLQFLNLTCRLLGLSVSLVTLSDGGGGGLGVVVDSDDGGPDSANKSTANATTNPYGDFGTASCRGQVGHSDSRSVGGG